MITIKTFIEEYPLYTKFSGEFPEYDYQLYPGIISLDCPVCKSSCPFHKPNYPRIIGMGSDHTVPPSPKSGIHSLEYKCTGCLKETFLCWIEVETQHKLIRKVGQVPAWSKRPDRNLEKLLSTHQDYYKKGLACESHGYGIGANAYYRRIVEAVIDELLGSITELIEPSEKEKYLKAIEQTKKTIVAQEKIALVKDLLPAVLRPDGMNPLLILHGGLSEGLHAETDEECLESAKHIREVLIFLVNQIALHRESSKRFTDSMRKLLEKKSGKVNEG